MLIINLFLQKVKRQILLHVLCDVYIDSQFSPVYNESNLIGGVTRSMKEAKLMHGLNINLSPRRRDYLRPHPYEALLRQSKNMGRVATGAFDTITHEIKDVLNKEITLPPSEQILATLPGMQKRRAGLDKIAALKKRVKKSHQVLANVQTVFPMTLFPGSVIVDRLKVTIIKRDFFWSSHVVSLQIDDILNVTAGVGPLFGSLNIASRVMNSIDHFSVNYLWREDALFLKRLIQGSVLARQNHLDMDQLSLKETVASLYELGNDSGR